MNEKIIQTILVTKRFGGLIALNQASLYVRKAEILGLVGPNGAGKTVLFNVISGAYRATSGKVIYRGQDISRLPAYQRCRMGIGRTFQITKPFVTMNVLNNVVIGGLFGTGRKYFSLSNTVREECENEALRILEFMEMSKKKDVPAGTLNVPERKRLEMCRALASKPDLLLLDEVIAGLNPSEVGGIVEMIRRINESGVSVLMIEHVMKAVMSLSHRLYVLNFGKVIAEGSPHDIVNNQTVIEAYLGKRMIQSENNKNESLKENSLC
jgi:branched-chain amino acid transport system ATP-binding protein